MTAPLTSLTLDGVEHQLANFSEGVRNAAQLFQKLSIQQNEAQVEYLKCDLAVRAVADQIRAAILAELAAQEPAADDDTVVTDVEAKTQAE